MARTRLRRSDRALLTILTVGLLTGLVVGSWAGFWRGLLVALVLITGAYLVVRATTSARKMSARSSVRVP